MNRPTPQPLSKPFARITDEPVIRDQLVSLKAQQERLFAQLAHGQQHFKQLARSVWRVQEDERRRLARELHDGLGQNLTALKHHLDAIGRDPQLADEVRARIEGALALCVETLEETRALSRMLRPQILDDLGVEPALQWLARSVGESASLRIEVDCNALAQAPDNDLATLIYRVVQEALNNVTKHARASDVVVRLATRGPELHVLVGDDGQGCDPVAALERSTSGLSTGLGSIRERVALFGGRFSFNSAVGEGTQVRVVLPCGNASGAPIA